jgi:hypothetical protein
MITLTTISNADTIELPTIENQLIVNKMKLDKFFSIFLDSTEMSEDNDGSPEWVTYREMLKEYERITTLLRAAQYRLHRYV